MLHIARIPSPSCDSEVFLWSRGPRGVIARPVFASSPILGTIQGAVAPFLLSLLPEPSTSTSHLSFCDLTWPIGPSNMMHDRLPMDLHFDRLVDTEYGHQRRQYSPTLAKNEFSCIGGALYDASTRPEGCPTANTQILVRNVAALPPSSQPNGPFGQISSRSHHTCPAI